MMNKSKISAKILQDFIQKHYEITGTMLDQRQAKLVMGLAVKQPLRTGAEIAKEQGVNLEELTLDTPFGRIEYNKREVTTGGFGEAITKVVDEKGNQVYKYVPKVRLGKSVAEEVFVLSGTADEEVAGKVSERLQKENNWIAPYKADTLEFEKFTIADHLSREVTNLLQKLILNDTGIDIKIDYARIPENNGLVDFAKIDAAKRELLLKGGTTETKVEEKSEEKSDDIDDELDEDLKETKPKKEDKKEDSKAKEEEIDEDDLD